MQGKDSGVFYKLNSDFILPGRRGIPWVESSDPTRRRLLSDASLESRLSHQL